MKPRLPSAPLTKEDTFILYRMAAGQLCPPWSWQAADSYRAADRRDAEIMLLAGLNNGYSFILLADHDEPLYVRGWDWLTKRFVAEGFTLLGRIDSTYPTAHKRH